MNEDLCGGLMMTGLGVLVLWVFGRWIFFGLKSRFWPRVSAMVLEVKERAVTANRSSATIPLGKTQNVVYRFEFAGRAFTGNRMKFGVGCFSGYSAGQVIEVSVDPQNPKRSVVHPGVFSEWRFALLASVAVFGVGCYFLIKGLREHGLVWG